MSIEVPPLTRAAIFPPLEIISRLQKFVPNASFAELLKLCESFSLLNDNYFMSIKPPLIEFAEYLDGFPLSLDDKYYLLGAPFPPLDLEFCRKITDLFLTRLAESKPFRLNLNFNRLESSETLNVRLEKLEMSYKIVDLYVWLSSRFGFIFTEVDSVNSFSNEINEEIQKVLQEIEIDNKNSFGFHKE